MMMEVRVVLDRTVVADSDQCSLRSRRLEVAGERENRRARGRHARAMISDVSTTCTVVIFRVRVSCITSVDRI